MSLNYTTKQSLYEVGFDADEGRVCICEKDGKTISAMTRGDSIAMAKMILAWPLVGDLAIPTRDDLSQSGGESPEYARNS
jgi:hypothetical protein